jgi:hypothetical protein
MKKVLLNFRFLLAFTFIVSISHEVKAALNGTYTIDSSQAATATNYRDFLSAIGDLRTGTRPDGGTPNGTGVSGPVVFNVAAGTYPGQLDITGITGVSATNTITFDGGAGNAATRVVIHTTATSLATAYTIRINNQQYIILRNLTITAGSTGYGWPLHIYSTSSNVKVKECIINFTTAFTTHTGTAFSAVVMNNSTASPTSAGSSAINVEIDSNIISGGYGNYLYGTGANTGITFRRNQVSNTYTYGLYMQQLAQVKVNNNDLNLSPTGNGSSAGIYMTSCTASSGNAFEINGNKVTNAGQYGIYLASAITQVTPRSQMFNNTIAGGFRSATPQGIFISNGSSVSAWDVFHNSVNIDNVASATNACALFVANCCNSNSPNNLDIRNNILAVTSASSSAVPFYYGSTTSLQYVTVSAAAFDYNLYYKEGMNASTVIINLINNTFQTVANVINNNSYNVNSKLGNPSFTAFNNLLPFNGCYKGTPLTQVTTDINGKPRSLSAPNLGAYEVTPGGNDVGVEAVTAPVAPFIAGPQDVSVLIRNYGSNTVNSANVSYSVNGGLPVTVTYNGTLAPCATATVTFSGGNQYNFIANTPYYIKVYTDFPNATTDTIPGNDTLASSLIYSALSGNYTIDQSQPATSTNFTSFTDAVNALNSGGINGPVFFTVMDTTPYNEQVSLNNVLGVSATNTITFDGGAGNAANRILTFNTALQTSSYIFRINNTPWVTVRNLTIRSTGGSYGWPVHIMGNASSNVKIKNCVIDYVGGGNTSTGSQNFIGIVVNNSPQSASTTTTAFNIELDSNTITGGDCGIYAYCSSTNNYLVRNNTITNTNYYGIYMFLVYSSRINNNIINMRPTGNANSVGISMNNCYNNGSYAQEIMNNVINDAGQYGMNLYYHNNGTTYRARVVNNMIGGTFRSTDPSGIYLNNNAQNIDLWFNSVNLGNVATATQSAALKILTNVSGLDVRNNNLSVSDPSSSSYALYAEFAANFNTLDYNNYYKQNATRLLNMSGVIYSSANFKGAASHNANSVSVNPVYNSLTNLRTNVLCNNGVAIAGITTDFEGDLRNTPPDIGADENLVSAMNDLSVTQLQNPSVPLVIGTQDMRVVIRNNGSNTINSAVVSYSVNGGAPMDQQWSGTLNPCDSTVIEFNATSGIGGTDQRFSIIPGNAYSFKAYVSMPNFTTDGNTLNDTLLFGPYCPALSGTFYIDSAGVAGTDTFTSFTSAVLALNCGGVAGPVVFNVLKGTYIGQLTLNDVPGISAVNTVTFDGGAGNDSTRIVTYNSVSTASRHTWMMNNTRYISLKNLTIRGAGTTYGWPLHIFGTSSFISVMNCIIVLDSNGAAGTSDNFVPLVMNGSTTTPLSTATFNNITIESNKISGGNTNVYIYGNGSNTNISFRNNYLVNAYTNGLYEYNVIAPKTINNTVSMRSTSTTSTGMYLSNLITNATGIAEVNRNRVYNAGQFGVQLLNSTATVQRANFLNNSIGGRFRNLTSPTGIYVSSSGSWNIVHNSVIIDTSATGNTSSGAMYATASTLLDCRNNNFAVTHASAGALLLPFRSTASTTFIAGGGLNYNNYFKGGTPTNLINVSGTDYTPANFNTATAGGLNSINNNSGYVSGKDLIPVLSTNNGILLSALTNRDINDSIRNNPPDIGAFEVASGFTNDLGLVASISPDTALSSGIKNVTVLVKNFGLSTINSFVLHHTVNGASQQDSTITGLNIAPGDTLTVTLSGNRSVVIPGGILTTYKVFLDNPNLAADDNQVNDTITIGPKIPTLNGVYTINPSGSGATNFVSFRAAIGALNIAGVSGPVTFMVAAATYNEQVNLGTIYGVSAVNTITFDGGAGNAATRIIDTTANTTTNYWTVKLNNSPYVTFRNLTIRAGGASYGVGVQIAGTSDYSRIKNCNITIAGAGATSTGSGYIGVLISNLTTITSLTSSGAKVNNLEIDSNTITAGYAGIYSYALTSTPYMNNNKYRNNTITGSYLYGAYYYYNEAVTFANNTVSLRWSTASSYGLYLDQCQNTTTNYHNISGNSFTRVNRFGIYVSGGNAVARNLMSNNMITGFNNTASYGIYLTNAYNYDVYHNTVYLDTTTNSQQYAAFNLSYGSNFDVKNNIFASYQSGSGLPMYLPGIPAGYVLINNNNYYKFGQTNGTQVFYVNGNGYTPATLAGGQGYNLASVSVDPGFIGNGNLHLVNGCAGKAPMLAGLTKDIDGDNRGSLTNLGADEAIGLTNDAGIVAILPFSAGLQDVKVLIRNYGGNPLTSVNVAYSVNGGIAKVTQWTGTLNPCDTVTVVFTGVSQYNFAAGTTYTIEAYTSQPNLASDPKTSNDTIILGPTCIFLSGNYTIDPAGSGAANFLSFSDAVSALNCGGVSSPVVFKVAPGTYNEQLVIGAIPGASAVNTITFDGDSAANRTLTFNSTVATSGYTLKLEGANYVNFRNLKISNTGTGLGSPVQISTNTQNIRIRKCIIDMPVNATGQGYNGILISSTANVQSPYTSALNVANIEIDSNRFIGGYAALWVYGNSSPYTYNIVVRNNTIDSAYYYGAYMFYVDKITFENNVLNMRVIGSNTSYGIQFNNCYAQGTNIHNINNNQIYNAGAYGIYTSFTYGASTLARSKMINNVVGGTFRSATNSNALFMQYSYYWDVWHNTLNLNFPTSADQYSTAFFTNCQQMDIRNNHFIYNAVGGGLPLSIATTGQITTLDYNNYYNAGAGNLVHNAGVYYNSGSLIGGGGYNLGSRNINPGFVSSLNLAVGNACINGVAIPSVTTDITGVTRNSPPDIGAYEFTGSINNDIGVSFLNSPAIPFPPGSYPINVRISNFGANTVNSATIKYTINGGAPVTYNHSGTLNACDTLGLTISPGALSFNMGNSYTIKIWTELPNGVADGNTANDTFVITSCPALPGGNYTIDPAGSGPNNFTSFTDVTNVLNCGGIGGAVHFTVAPGTYNEQVTLMSVIGTSATNTITFDGVNAATRIINFAPGSNFSAHTFRVANTPYVTLRNFTISSSGASFGNPVHIMGTSDYTKVKNCIITFSGTAQTGTGSSYIGLLINNETNIYSPTNNGTKGNNMEIDSNRIMYGYYGIIDCGINTSPYSNGTVYRNNIVDSAYYYGIYIYIKSGIKMLGNTISMRSGNINSMGVYMYNSSNNSGSFHEISANRVRMAGRYGIYVYFTSHNSSARGRLFNNMIGGGFSSATARGLFFEYSSYWDVFNNTVNLDFPTNSTQNSAMMVGTSASNNDIRNNHFIYSAATGTGLAMYSSQTFTQATLNYNNYYNSTSPAADLLYTNGQTYTPGNFAVAAGINSNSLNIDPGFSDRFNLSTGGCFKGVNIPAVTTDIDNQPRNNPPDIGADEADSNDVGIVSLTAPVEPVSAGSQDVVLQIRNYGGNVVNNLTVSYNVNNTGVVTQNLTSLNLQPCSTATVTFSGASQFNFPAGRSVVVAYISSTNGSPDRNRANDTLKKSLCGPLSGNYTINAAGSGASNFNSFSEAISTMLCAGIAGPVNFDVAAGTYNEQVTMPVIAGASATNTITFDGGAGNAATRILTFGTNDVNARHTVRFNSQYVTFRNLTIQSTGINYGWGVHFASNANNNNLIGCVVDIAGPTALTSASTNYCGVVVSASNTSPTSAASINNIRIDSNTVKYGYYSIVVYGNTGTTDTAVYIRKNTVNNAYYTGIYSYSIEGLTIDNNTVSTRGGGVNLNQYGIYVNNCTQYNTANPLSVSANKVFNVAQVGIYLTSSGGTAGASATMNNNMVGGGFQSTSATGIYIFNASSNWDVYNNSVNLDFPTTSETYAAMMVYIGLNNIRMKNNNLAVTAAGSTGLPLYSYNTTSFPAGGLNYNNYYKVDATSTSTLINVAGAYTPITFNIGGGANSFNRAPGFRGNLNLHTLDGCFNGDSLGVMFDIDGEPRASYADIGADEVSDVNNDIGVTALLQPAIPLNPGLTDIQVIVKNFGTNPVYNATVSYSVNGGFPVSQVIYDTIMPCDTALVTFTGSSQYNFSSGTYSIKAYTSLPNDSDDYSLINDTFATPQVCLAMNGAYTIDPAGAGANNFTSFQAALDALQCSGVSGPVTFTVAAGTYNEQLVVGSILGASSTNTVTFTGGAGNAATRILTYGATTNTNRQTVRFAGAAFVSFEDLTIRNTGATYAWPVHIFSASRNISLRRNIIEITGAGAAGTSQDYTNIVISGSTTNISSVLRVDSIQIDSNIINNGYASIYDYNGQSLYQSFNYNTLNNPNYYGIYIYNSYEVKIRKNIINMSPTGNINSVGLYLFVIGTVTGRNNEISGNKIVDMGQYGIYLYSSSGFSSIGQSRIENNMIGGGFRNTAAYSGIWSEYSSNWNIWFNSINMDTACTAINGAIHMSNGSGLDVRNNIFAVTYSGSNNNAIPLYAATTANTAALNYNNYYKAGSVSTLIYHGAPLPPSGYIGVGGFNNNSFSIDPLFTSAKDLHVNNGCNNGITIAGSTVDIDGDTRTTPPDVGADEVTAGFVDNIGVTAIVQPSVPLTTGAQDVIVILANLGNNVVTNATISYSVNGGTPVSQFYTDSLQPCDTALIVFTGINGYTFNQGSSYTIKAYTSFPNGVNDNNNIDDTTTYGPVCPSMFGAYTIDPAGSGSRNFVNFTAAVNALGCAGISSEVTFTVANATYTEQVTIPPITGASSTNRVSFIGQSKTGTVLTYSAFNANNAHTLKINNSSFITFRNMTIQSQGGSVGLPVHIMGSSNDAKIKNCVIRVGGSGSTSTSSTFIGVLVNNSSDINSPTSGTGSYISNLELDSNTIYAGYYSVLMFGRTSSPYSNNNAVRGNIIDSSYYYGYYAYYHSGVKFNDNRVTMRSTTGTTGSIGAYLYFCYNNAGSSHEIIGNKVINAGNYGLNVYYSTNTLATPGKMYNNMIGGGFRTTNAYGVYFFQSNYWNVYHNSINMDFATNNNQYSALYINAGANNNVRNNIIAYSATSGSGLPVYITGTYTGTMNNNNYNNAVSASATLLNINGTVNDPTNYTTNGGGANSYNTVTGFMAPKDLSLAMPTVKGASGLGVLTDIDGQARSTTTPDVGADEYFGVLDAGVYAIDSPTTAQFCGRTRNIVVRLRNYGNQTITSTTINYSVNDIPAGSYNWVGTLAPGAISGQINIGSYNFAGGAYKVAAQVFMPNGLTTDTIPANDTAFQNFTTTPSVTPAITLSASQTTLCSGVEVTFIASYTGGGATPALQWRKNGITLPFAGDTLKTTALNDGDSFIVILSSSATCATPPSVISNHVKMNVGLTVAPEVTLVATTNTICAGQNVTFTATPLNGGSAPTYTWYKNGVVVGGDSSTYAETGLQHGDSVTVVLNSSLGCASPPKDTSSFVKMTVNPLQLTSANITASSTSFCAGTSVTFAATTVNQGTTPVYQWRRNGIAFGPNNDTLVVSSLSNNDSISLVVTSNALCATPAVFESNKIGVNVIALVNPSVTIATTTGTICTGSNATFTAAPVKAGVNATYNWTVNSVPSGTGNTFSSATLNNNDTIRLYLTADTLCATPQTVQSNGVVINVKQYIAPDVTITPLNPGVCAGGSVSFTATPVNGGTAPSYQWLRNGVPVGTDSVKYQGVFNTNDSVAVILTSNEMCLSRTSDTSAHAYVNITAPVTPGVSVTPSATSVCANGSITLTATPVNGGTAPAYQWKRNGLNFGTNNAVQTVGSINNTDSFWVVMTSNAGCAVPLTATSAKVNVTVIPNVTPSVTIASSVNTICAGGSVTFTATPVNGGTTPVYQWKKNGNNIGIDSAVQTFTGINNGDNFTVVITSNATCASPLTATSAGRQITVTNNVTPAVSILASKTSICLGESVTYTATPVNGGTTPSYQWKINGVDAGTNSNTFTSTTISGTDSVYVVLTSSVTCVTSPTATSNKIKLNANPALVPSVTVNASATNICMGTSITFVATPVNGGTTPVYQWKVNGVNMGSNNDSFTTSTLTNTDSVYVVLTSNALCASPATVTSAKTVVTVNTPVTPGLSIEASTTAICKGTAVTYTATTSNGGTTPSYKWLKNGVEVGTNSDTYVTTDLLPDEDVACVLTTSLSCVTATTATELAPGVLVKLPPAKPTIVRNNNTLSTAFATQGYQWIKNDTDIAGANMPTYLMVANGAYSVRVDSNGCTSTSDKLTVTDILVGLKEASTIGSISLYPNPAELSAHLQVNFVTTEATEITLVDMYGKLVKTIPVGTVNSFEGNIGLDEVADGVYFVIIRHGDDMAQKRLVKAGH